MKIFSKWMINSATLTADEWPISTSISGAWLYKLSGFCCKNGCSASIPEICRAMHCTIQICAKFLIWFTHVLPPAPTIKWILSLVLRSYVPACTMYFQYQPHWNAKAIQGHALRSDLSHSHAVTLPEYSKSLSSVDCDWIGKKIDYQPSRQSWLLGERDLLLVALTQANWPMCCRRCGPTMWYGSCHHQSCRCFVWPIPMPSTDLSCPDFQSIWGPPKPEIRMCPCDIEWWPKRCFRLAKCPDWTILLHHHNMHHRGCRTQPVMALPIAWYLECSLCSPIAMNTNASVYLQYNYLE